MPLTIKNAKTLTEADWTQAQLDAQIALGNYLPGTLISQISQPSDYNAALVVTGILDVANGGYDYSVTTKAADYTVLLADAGKTLAMNAATTKTFSLPSVDTADIGLELTFCKIGVGKVIIDAADSDTIADSSAGATIFNDLSNETYATIKLKLITSTKWLVIGGFGTWITT